MLLSEWYPGLYLKNHSVNRWWLSFGIFFTMVHCCFIISFSKIIESALGITIFVSYRWISNESAIFHGWTNNKSAMFHLLISACIYIFCLVSFKKKTFSDHQILLMVCDEEFSRTEYFLFECNTLAYFISSLFFFAQINNYQQSKHWFNVILMALNQLKQLN